MNMIRTMWRAALAAVVVALAACGGGSNTCVDIAGGDACSGGGGGVGGTPQAAELVLVLGAQSVTNDGSQSVVASVIAVDANRNSVAGVPVTVSVNNGGVVIANDTVTDSSGILSATIGIGSDFSERTITVTARSGSLRQTAALQVTSTGGSTVLPSDLILTLSSPTIVNTGAEQVTATVTALDAKRNVLPNTGVTITVDNGATAAPSGTVTNVNGTVTALVGIGGLSTNRTIVVTAVAGGLTRTANLVVTDTATTAGPVASDLSLSLSASSLPNAGTSTLRATVAAVDANRNALPGIPVTIRVDESAVATVSGSVTNTAGIVTADIGIGADRSNRLVTVTATSGGLTRTASFRVIGAKLTSAFSPIVNTSSTGNQIEFTLVDVNDVAMPDQIVSLTSPQLGTASGTTDARGKYVYSYVAPASPGTVTVTASAAGYALPEDIQITVQTAGTGSVPVAVGPVDSASLTPSPSVVSVNADASTDNQVQLRALFVKAGNTPIANVRVRFDLADNVNNSDGTVSWVGGDYAYTNANGVATGTFRAGTRSSPTNGVTIRACYALTDWDFATTACPNSVTSTITVASEALSVNIRTNELIKSGDASLTYIKEFVVMVVDAAGQAKPDVQITPSVDLTGFYKGFYFWNGDFWQQQLTLANTENYSWSGTAWTQGGTTTQPVCPNDDANRNGIRETGEDLNGNGEIDPRKADVAIKMVGSSKTDANGLAIVQIEYGRSLGTWVDFVVTVTASGVAGTEARARFVGNLYGLGNLPVPGSA
ncbi:MAG: Ig-like domain-containing protein, partial [Rhodoferax sp.]|nr:Ig-like domain-containing protein [Rhodoferax sp.]